jgi:hypothetical protein
MAKSFNLFFLWKLLVVMNVNKDENLFLQFFSFNFLVKRLFPYSNMQHYLFFWLQYYETLFILSFTISNIIFNLGIVLRNLTWIWVGLNKSLYIRDYEAQIRDTIQYRYDDMRKFSIRYGRDTLFKKLNLKLNI